MNILNSWRDSILLLKPKSASLLLLVSLNAFFSGWRFLWPYFVGIGVLLMPLISMVGIRLMSIVVGVEDMSITVGTLFFLLSLFLWCLVIHPSVEKKTLAYFFSFSSIFSYFFALVIPLFIGYVIRLIFFLWGVIVYDLFALWGLLLFFSFLDAEKSVSGVWHALVRTVKIVIYNAPLWAIVFGIFYGIESINYIMTQNINPHDSLAVVGAIVMFLFDLCVFRPFCIAFIDTIYVKRVYDNRNFYR